jgi:hypothetical protein
MTGDEKPRGAGMVSAHTCYAAGTFFFTAFDLRYLSDKFALGAPLEAALPIGELYVNSSLAARHNQYRKATHHAIVLDAAGAISKYTCSPKGEMC